MYPNLYPHPYRYFPPKKVFKFDIFFKKQKAIFFKNQILIKNKNKIPPNIFAANGKWLFIKNSRFIDTQQ